MAIKQRNPAFDVLKTILMYFVVVSHLFPAINRKVRFIDALMSVFL